ncbi:MAG: FtsW/RodA/SpoVE family cell cycle protein [Ilumatobacteraceae bacterium]
MSTTTVIGDRRRVATDRAQSMRRHPTNRETAAPATPPPISFYVIFAVITVLTLLGLVMVLSATSVSQFHKGNSPWRIFGFQALYAIAGFFALAVVLGQPLRRIRRLTRISFIVSLGLMVLPFVPSLGVSVDGARAWIEIGGFSFQPSELVKLTLLLQAADLLTRRQQFMHDPRRTLFPVLGLGLLAAGMSMVQDDLGSAIVITAIVFAIAFLAGAPLLPMMAVGAVGTVGVVALAMATPRRADRFTAFLDLAAHKDSLSFQTWQAMIAMAQGGLTGSGVGRGENKLGEFLPLAHSDFIFAVVAEELGMFGVVAVLGGFTVLAYAGVQVALASHDRFHQLVAGGIVAWFVVQALINVGGVTGLLPVTGLTLPFISAGGSSLLVSLVAAGLLLNVARNVR